MKKRKRLVAIGILKGKKKIIRHTDDCLLFPPDIHKTESAVKIIKSLSEGLNFKDLSVTTHGVTEPPEILKKLKLDGIKGVWRKRR